MNQEDIDKIKQGRGTFNYKGVLVEKIIAGWKVLNVICASPEEVQQVLDNSHQSIEKSIIYPCTVKNGFEVTNTNENT